MTPARLILFFRAISILPSHRIRLRIPPPTSPGTPLVKPRLTLGRFAEQMRMEVPKDLGRRIVEAARLAVALHLQRSFGLEPQVGGADSEGHARADHGALTARP